MTLKELRILFLLRAIKKCHASSIEQAAPADMRRIIEIPSTYSAFYSTITYAVNEKYLHRKTHDGGSSTYALTAKGKKFVDAKKAVEPENDGEAFKVVPTSADDKQLDLATTQYSNSALSAIESISDLVNQSAAQTTLIRAVHNQLGNFLAALDAVKEAPPENE